MALADTAYVVTANVLVLAPAAKKSDGGTVAAAVLALVRLIVAPAGGAEPVSVTVAVDGFPPTTLVGLRAIEVMAAALTVSVAVFETPP